MFEDSRMLSLSILVVDDQPFIRTTIKQMLRRLGIVDIQEAVDGTDALKQCEFSTIDLVFLDIGMEPMDGLAFLKHIRSSSTVPLKRMPVIMLTTYADEIHVQDCIELGIQGYIAKPVSLETLKKSIVRALDVSSSGRSVR